MTSTLIKARDLKFNPLEDAVMADLPPDQWNGPHVGKRMAEAFQTLMAMPVGGKRSTGCWPVYRYEWQDLIAQQEQAEEEKNRARKVQNRSRIAASILEISRMECALYWPMHYLFDLPRLMAATNAMAFAHALDHDASWVAGKRGGYAFEWQRQFWDGCDIIARGLIVDKVAVF